MSAPTPTRSGTSWWLQTARVADDVAGHRAPLGVPAGAVGRQAAGVEAQAGDHHPGVAAVGVDGHPLAVALLTPRLEACRVQLGVEQPGAVERVGDRTGAVVAAVLPLAVTAAVDVRLG